MTDQDLARYGFNKWIVVPSHRTGTSLDGTAEFVWKAVYSRWFNKSYPAGVFDSSSEAWDLAERLTAQNAEF